MAEKCVEDVLYDLKREAIQKVFGKKRIKIYPEDFLPRKIKNTLNSMEHLDEAESKINVETAEKYRKLKRVCRKKKAEYFWAGQKYYNELEKNLSYEVYVLPVWKFKVRIEKETQICFENGRVFCRFDSFYKARYMMLSMNKGRTMLMIPKDKKIVKRAVEKYEEYMQKLMGELTAFVMGKNITKKTAELVAGQIMMEKFKN